MHLNDWLTARAWPPGRYLDWLAAGIAQRCFPAVAEAIQEQAVRMTLADARGYLRARINGLIAAETEATIRRHDLAVHFTAALADRAVEDLLSLSVQAILYRKIRANSTITSRQAA